MAVNKAYRWILLLIFLVAQRVTVGQWMEESLRLEAGWNAIYLSVDLSHTTLDRLVGSDGANPIEEIWMWVPPGPDFKRMDGGDAMRRGSTEWLKWKRAAGEETTLNRLPGNVACLVRVAESGGPFEWTVKGRAMPPRPVEWSSSGINFLGFPTHPDAPPGWGEFLGLGPAFADPLEIFRYVGGPLDSTNPQKISSSLYRALTVNRNEAYWMRSDDYNRRFGPFEVELEQSSGIEFGRNRGQFRFWLRNRSEVSQTVTAALIESLPAPGGEPPVSAQVPLLLRGEQDLEDLRHGFTRFSEGEGQWTLPPEGEPGWEVEVVVGLDRNEMSGPEGALHAGILRLEDADGFYRVHLPVSAETASLSGLWVGQALVGEVAQYLVDYSIGDDGEPVRNDDGSYQIEGVDESYGPVARPFPLRLIVHDDGSGDTRLLQRVYYGPDRSGQTVLAHTEDALDPQQLEEARRLSVAHLPWSGGNTSWVFNGSLTGSGPITTQVDVAYDESATNPFVHTYHPDHDNKDARFEDTLPRGSESYDIVRQITLEVQPPGNDFEGMTTGWQTLSGRYQETLILRGRLTDSGSDARTFRTRGGFALNRITDITELVE